MSDSGGSYNDQGRHPAWHSDDPSATVPDPSTPVTSADSGNTTLPSETSTANSYSSNPSDSLFLETGSSEGTPDHSNRADIPNVRATDSTECNNAVNRTAALVTTAVKPASDFATCTLKSVVDDKQNSIKDALTTDTEEFTTVKKLAAYTPSATADDNKGSGNGSSEVTTDAAVGEQPVANTSGTGKVNNTLPTCDSDSNILTNAVEESNGDSRKPRGELGKKQSPECAIDNALCQGVNRSTPCTASANKDKTGLGTSKNTPTTKNLHSGATTINSSAADAPLESFTSNIDQTNYSHVSSTGTKASFDSDSSSGVKDLDDTWTEQENGLLTAGKDDEGSKLSNDGNVESITDSLNSLSLACNTSNIPVDQLCINATDSSTRQDNSPVNVHEDDDVYKNKLQNAQHLEKTVDNRMGCASSQATLDDAAVQSSITIESNSVPRADTDKTGIASLFTPKLPNLQLSKVTETQCGGEGQTRAHGSLSGDETEENIEEMSDKRKKDRQGKKGGHGAKPRMVQYTLSCEEIAILHACGFQKCCEKKFKTDNLKMTFDFQNKKIECESVTDKSQDLIKEKCEFLRGMSRKTVVLSNISVVLLKEQEAWEYLLQQLTKKKIVCFLQWADSSTSSQELHIYADSPEKCDRAQKLIQDVMVYKSLCLQGESSVAKSLGKLHETLHADSTLRGLYSFIFCENDAKKLIHVAAMSDVAKFVFDKIRDHFSRTVKVSSLKVTDTDQRDCTMHSHKGSAHDKCPRGAQVSVASDHTCVAGAEPGGRDGLCTTSFGGSQSVFSATSYNPQPKETDVDHPVQTKKVVGDRLDVEERTRMNKVVNTRHNLQTDLGSEGAAANSASRMHDSKEELSAMYSESPRVQISALRAELLENNVVLKDFYFLLGRSQLTVDLQSLQSRHITVTKGDPETVKSVLDECLIEESVDFDKHDKERNADIDHLMQQKNLQFNGILFPEKNQVHFVYHREVKSAVAPAIAKLREPFLCHIPLPFYKANYVWFHKKEFADSISKRMHYAIAVNVTKGSDGYHGLSITVPRTKVRDAERVVFAELAKLARLNTETDLAIGLFLQDTQQDTLLKQDPDDLTPLNMHSCMLSVSTPWLPTLISASSPGGHKLVICGGSLATSDCDVLVLPLCAGQTQWHDMHRKLLEDAFLPADIEKYSSEIGSPEDKPKKPFTVSLQCNKRYSGKTMVVMYVSRRDPDTFKHHLTKACGEVIMVAANAKKCSICLPLTLGADLPVSKVLTAVTECLMKCPPDTAPVVKLCLDVDSTTMKASQDQLRAVETHLSMEGWITDSLLPPRFSVTSHIRVVVEDVKNIQADVFVNSTDTALFNTKAHVSKVLLEAAGPGLAEECQRLYPRGIEDNLVAVTRGFNTQFKEIFHIALPIPSEFQKKEFPKHLLFEMKILVKACLGIASGRNYQTIAFPTLGLGKLSYPPEEVAETMFRAAIEFFTEMPHSSLKDVKFMCFHTDTAAIKAFKAEKLSHGFVWNSSGGSTVVRMNINNTLVLIVKGDPGGQKGGADYILLADPPRRGVLDDYGNLKGVVPVRSTEIMTCVKTVFQHPSASVVQIDMGTFDQKFYSDIVNAIVASLHTVLVLSIAVPTDEDLHLVGGMLKNAVKRPQGGAVHTVMDFFKGEWRKATEVCQSREVPLLQREPLCSVQILGPWNIVQEVMNKIQKLQPPEEYYKKADSSDQGLMAGSSVDQENPQLPTGHHSRSMVAELQDAMQDIEEDKESAIAPDTCTFIIPAESLRGVSGEEFSQFLKSEAAIYIQGYCLSRDKQNMIFRAKLNDLMNAVGVVLNCIKRCTALKGRDEFVGQTIDFYSDKTTAKKEKMISKELRQEEFEALQYLLGEPFNRVVTVTKREKEQVLISGMITSLMWNKIDSLRREDMQLPASELEKLGHGPLDTSEENLDAFIKPLPDQGKVAILTFDYNTITKAKHLVSVKAGKVKVTARARRRFDGGQGSGLVDLSAPHSMDSFSSQSVTGESKEFITKSGIKVQVYKTDITKLPVDAIVNAANGHLCHGGGVAYAISRAAGLTLEQEGDAYVNKNGPLKVTDVISTTAGAMPCKKVLHAVGPRWEDYQDKTLCQQDLEQTVFNCLVAAHNLQFLSLAVSSISSAIFGVPKELCAQMYLSAVKSFDQQYGNRTSLHMIHFVDVSDQMVSVVQDIFSKGWDTGGMAAGCGAPYIHQGAALLPRNSYTVSDNISPQTEYSLSACGEGTCYPLSEVQTNPPHTNKEESDQRVPVVTVVSEQNHQSQYIFHFVGLDLNFQKQRVDNIQADAVVLWQYVGNGLKSEASKQLIRGWTSAEIRALIRKLTNGSVETVRTEEKLYVLPVLSNWGPLTKEAVSSLLEQAINKANELKKRSLAITCCSANQGCNKANDDVDAFAAGVYVAVKNYTQKSNRSIHKIYIIDTESQILRAMEDKIIEMVAIDKSKMDVGTKQGLPSAVQPSSRGGSVPGREQCVICHEKITDPQTLKCSHTFCSECIKTWAKIRTVCPSCNAAFGVQIGDQPDGRMEMHRSSQSLPGFKGNGSYMIEYKFQLGTQTIKHPHPGRWYQGTTRTAYLPDTPEGRKVLMLLKVAFDRRLVFTVGQSNTTGHDDCVIWNDIHHKTSSSGGSTNFGYPDPNYLARVEKEIAAKGVTYDDLTEKQKDFIQYPEKYHRRTHSDFCYMFQIVSDV